MRYGFWTPVFGGWLRNVPDEHMAATWDYTKRLCQRAEKVGYDLNAMSNFVAKPLEVLGWDPHDNLVDFLLAELAATRKAAA